MEILTFSSGDTEYCQVWDYNGNVLFEGTYTECEDYISDNDYHE